MKKKKVIVTVVLICCVGVFLWMRFDTSKTQEDLENASYNLNDTDEPVYTKSLGDVCLTSQTYSEETDSGLPVLTLPFDMEDFSSKFWGVVPFCADQWEIGRLHNALDFELTPDAKIYAAEDGEVLFVNVGEDEGAGDVIDVIEGDFKMDYAGLTNVQVKKGDKIKRGDYLGDAALTPYGEYHLHLGISTKGVFQCPIKYMDEEFIEVTREMFAEAHYPSESEFPCACNCESLDL